MDVLREPLDGAGEERTGDDTLGDDDRNDGDGLDETLGREGADTLGDDERNDGDGLDTLGADDRYDGDGLEGDDDQTLEDERDGAETDGPDAYEPPYDPPGERAGGGA